MSGSVTRVARRAPVQARSRQRVEGILSAAEALVTRNGVEGLSTRDIAQTAGIPVASLYQYFSDKDDILLALAGQQMAEMDQQVAEDLAALDAPTIASAIETTMRGFVSVYSRRPAFVQLYLQGRTNAAINAFGRQHNAEVARALLAYGRDAGLFAPTFTEAQAVLAVEVGDRVFQLAYADDVRGDQAMVNEGIALVTAYVERFSRT